MKILMTGATGLIGSALTPFLEARGHEVIPLRRRSTSSPDKPSWWPNPKDPRGIDLARVGPIDAVIHLAGETIAQRWSEEAKRRIRESRWHGTLLLSDALAKRTPRPKVFLSASATGIYGNRGDEWLDEQSPPGDGFLAAVCRNWESATQSAVAAGIRVINLRFGIVLSRHGGALRKMLPPFRLGLGGPLGDGGQYWSWIAIDDLVKAVELALLNDSLRGPMNVVSPNPVTNAEFTKCLASALHRPAFFRVPKFAIKLLMGEMGEEALLSSFRVKPARLLEQKFQFAFAYLATALKHELLE